MKTRGRENEMSSSAKLPESRDGRERKLRPKLILMNIDGAFLGESKDEIASTIQTLRSVHDSEIAICACSSRTAAEIRILNESLAIRDPFICENGGAIQIPKGYFQNFPVREARRPLDYELIELGKPISEVVTELRRLAGHGIAIHSLFELSDLELNEKMGVTPEEGRYDFDRHYDVPFWLENPDDFGRLRALVRDDFTITKGDRYFHLTGGADKGRAARELLKLYRGRCVNLRTAAIGDSATDIPMLLEADIPILVQRSNGDYDSQVTSRVPHVRKAEGIGPVGWSNAVHWLIETGEFRDG